MSNNTLEEVEVVTSPRINGYKDNMVVNSHSNVHTYTNGPDKYQLVPGYVTITKLFNCILLLPSQLLQNHYLQKLKFLSRDTALSNYQAYTHTRLIISGSYCSGNNNNNKVRPCRPNIDPTSQELVPPEQT